MYDLTQPRRFAQTKTNRQNELTLVFVCYVIWENQYFVRPQTVQINNYLPNQNIDIDA